MKTLDEVIKALEICSTHQRCIDGCPYYKNDCPLYEMEKDALHYLREYRENQQAYEEVKKVRERIWKRYGTAKKRRINTDDLPKNMGGDEA